jgi:hypothetical protein
MPHPHLLIFADTIRALINYFDPATGTARPGFSRSVSRCLRPAELPHLGLTGGDRGRLVPGRRGGCGRCRTARKEYGITVVFAALYWF